MALNDESRKKLKAILGVKLVETVGSCENELPDYIISMITNNKTKEYMRDNLTLFIGEHAEAFSEWLCDLKDRLYRECPAVVKTEEKAKVEAKRPKTPEREVKQERRRDESAEKRKRSERDDRHHRSPRTNNRDRRDERKRSSPERRDHRSHRTSRRESPVLQRRERSRSPLDSSKSTVRSSASAKHVDRSDSKNRDMPSRLFGNAFMKAIEEASRVAKEKMKSTKDDKIRVDVVEKRRDEEKSIVRSLSSNESSGPSVTVRLNSGGFKVPTNISDESSPKTALKRKIVLDLDTDEVSPVKKEKPTAVPFPPRFSKPAVAPNVPKPEVVDDAENEATIDAFIAAAQLQQAIARQLANDIVNSGSQIKKEEEIEEEEAMEEEYMEGVEEEFPKAKTRCAFWPACRNGDNCEYAHPTVACIKFPYCAYGPQCLYIHPPCRYGPGCLNSNCGAIHGAPESIETVCKLLGIPVPEYPTNDAKNEEGQCAIDSALPSPYANIPCRFRNMCKNPDCKYKHPVECRYGRDCQMPMCAFRHPEGKNLASALPDAAKYKWKAPA